MLAGLPLDRVELLLTYLVPYLVSTHGDVSYRFHADKRHRLDKLHRESGDIEKAAIKEYEQMTAWRTNR